MVLLTSHPGLHLLQNSPAEQIKYCNVCFSDSTLDSLFTSCCAAAMPPDR